MKRYYLPVDNYYGSVGLPPYRQLRGAWVNLTSGLVSGLEPHEEQDSDHIRFNELFRGLPQEVKHQIVDLLPQGSLPLDCNYLVPQEEWKHGFVRTPFLWDLDHEAIHKKHSAPPNTEWNWEKLTRQVMSPVTVAEGLSFSAEAWSYGRVGLRGPCRGLSNRRRIWQMLEDMYPNDVGMRHDPDSDDEDENSA
ncbi:hypothetical protein FALCPG4_011088 [Fusarium falciforme]